MRNKCSPYSQPQQEDEDKKENENKDDDDQVHVSCQRTVANGMRQINFSPTISYFLFATFTTFSWFWGTLFLCFVLVTPSRSPSSSPSPSADCYLLITRAGRNNDKTFLGSFSGRTPGWTSRSLVERGAFALRLGGTPHHLHTSLCLRLLGQEFYFISILCFALI